MEINNKSSLVRWRCHRGMLELDMILLPFYDEQYHKLRGDLQLQFVELLECSDPELFDALIIGKKEIIPKYSHIIKTIIDYTVLDQ